MVVACNTTAAQAKQRKHPISKRSRNGPAQTKAIVCTDVTHAHLGSDHGRCSTDPACRRMDDCRSIAAGGIRLNDADHQCAGCHRCSRSLGDDHGPGWRGRQSDRQCHCPAICCTGRTPSARHRWRVHLARGGEPPSTCWTVSPGSRSCGCRILRRTCGVAVVQLAAGHLGALGTAPGSRTHRGHGIGDSHRVVLCFSGH